MENIMYRTEDAYGEGFRNPAAVMSHETFTLQNTDIPETLSTGLLKGTEIGLELDILVEEINHGYQSEDDKDGRIYHYVEAAYDNENIGIQFFAPVLEEIYRITGKSVAYCLWLADKETVIDYYGRGMDEITIDGYDTTDSVCVLSDCGYDGKLYGFVNEPTCVCSEIVRKQCD